jgi:hypothetical protein
MPANFLIQQPWWMPEHFDGIYGAAIGGAIGGAIALLTAFLTNRNARKRQVLDLAHSSSEREKERLYSLRRETYLPLVEAFSVAVGFIVQIPTLSVDQVRAQQPLVDFARLIARLGLIAPPAVQEAVQKAHILITALSFKLMNERMTIESICDEIASIDLNVQLRLNRQKELLMRQEKHIDDRTAEEQLMKNLNDQHRVASAEIDALLTRRGPLVQKKAVMQLDLLNIAVRDIPVIARQSTEALIAIRKDLDLTTDDQWLRKFTDDNSAHYGAAVQSFQDEIKQRITGSKAPEQTPTAGTPPTRQEACKP